MVGASRGAPGVTTTGDKGSRTTLIGLIGTSSAPGRNQALGGGTSPSYRRQAAVWYSPFCWIAWSRKVVGWVDGHHLRPELVGCVEMPIGPRRRTGIHTQRQGSQDSSLHSATTLQGSRCAASMGSSATPTTMRCAESFFATLECELRNVAALVAAPRRELLLHLYRRREQPGADLHSASATLALASTEQAMRSTKKKEGNHQARQQSTENGANFNTRPGVVFGASSARKLAYTPVS